MLAGAITATMGVYAFARLRFKGKKFLFTLVVGSMFLPTMVTLIPLYIMWTQVFRLTDSYLPLILPYFCGGGAFSIFRILFSIIVPAIKAAMITVAMLLFVQMWNDLLQQMIYINSSEKFTIAIGLS